MSDISLFWKIIEQPDAPLPDYVHPRFIWIRACKTESGRFCYRVGSGKHPISRLYTYSLVDARDAAKSFGLPVKEAGPAEAFGRKPKPAPSVATVEAFWSLVALGDPDRLKVWMKEHPADTLFLRKLIARL
jgi:hypothetical protein